MDARGLNQSGIGRYLRSILRSVLADPRFARVTLLGYPNDLAEFVATHDGGGDVEIISFPYRFYDPRAQAAWWSLRIQGRLRSDVSFFPHYDVPLASGAINPVVTVQDLTHFRLPHLFPAWKRALAGRVLRSAVTGARRILVSSQSTRADLVERHPEVAAKIEVVPLGVDRDFPSGARASTVASRSIESLRPYLLCVGNRKRSKNLSAAVEAMARLVDGGIDLRLVLAGQTFAGEDEVGQRAMELGVAERVLEVGPVSDAELRGLYAGAECLLFPSLYEGFGLPVLEAMAMETPVIASNRASTPEVAGNAALVVEPTADCLADAVHKLRENAGLRHELVRRGVGRAQSLTWDVTGKATADQLLEACNRLQPR